MRTGSWVENMYGCDCGSRDCPACHPELQDIVQCECCGEEFHLYEIDTGTGICHDCYLEADKCDACHCWTKEYVTVEDICLCEDCAEMVVKEWKEKH